MAEWVCGSASVATVCHTVPQCARGNGYVADARLGSLRSTPPLPLFYQPWWWCLRWWWPPPSKVCPPKSPYFTGHIIIAQDDYVCDNFFLVQKNVCDLIEPYCNLQTTEGWNIPKYSLNRWLSHKVHHWATILRFLPTIWFLQKHKMSWNVMYFQSHEMSKAIKC